MTENFTGFAYLIASVLFILALRGLSNPETARTGNFMGIAGMVIAIVTTLMDPGVMSYSMIILAMLIGGLLHDRTSLMTMAGSAKRLARRGAAARILQECRTVLLEVN